MNNNTGYPKILDIVKGYKISFHSKSFQSKVPSHPIASREGQELVKLEIKEVLKKGAIRKVQLSNREFVSNLFFVNKKDGDQTPVINLKQLNMYIPYCHFRMEGLQNLKYMLQKGDYMCKLDLQDAYFSVPLEKNSRQFVRFRWSGNSYEFLCLCFGLGPANIHKIVKSANDNPTQTKYKNNNLLRRHAIDWSLFRRDIHRPRHNNLPSATSRICHKLEKVLC